MLLVNTRQSLIWDALCIIGVHWCHSFAGERSEQESERGGDIAQLYQIIPDEVLGSGQFGIVYGGCTPSFTSQVFQIIKGKDCI